MANTLTNKEKLKWAKVLAERTNMTQLEIAEKVGVTPKTMSNWWNKHKFEGLRTSFFITKSQELQRIYVQISKLNNKIAESEDGYATTAQAYTLTKLASTARNLETETSLSETIEVFMKFIDFVRQADYEQAKTISDLMDAYIKSLL